MGILCCAARCKSKLEINSFTPKAPLIHYWNIRISNKEHLLLSKASHLTLHHYAILNNLLNQNFKPFTLKNYSNGLNANNNAFEWYSTGSTTLVQHEKIKFNEKQNPYLYWKAPIVSINTRGWRWSMLNTQKHWLRQWTMNGDEERQPPPLGEQWSTWT